MFFCLLIIVRKQIAKETYLNSVVLQHFGKCNLHFRTPLVNIEEKNIVTSLVQDNIIDCITIIFNIIKFTVQIDRYFTKEFDIRTCCF